MDAHTGELVRVADRRVIRARTGPALAPAPGQNSKASPFGLFEDNYAGGGRFQRWNYSAGTRGEARINKQISEAMKNLKSPRLETREEANKALTTAVADLFDTRTEVREKQIKELEDRLAKLRAQLNERKARKDEICQLHVQTLVNQANGLGF